MNLPGMAQWQDEPGAARTVARAYLVTDGAGYSLDMAGPTDAQFDADADGVDIDASPVAPKRIARAGGGVEIY